MKKTELSVFEMGLQGIDGNEEIVMALMINKEKGTECVLIGKEKELKKRLDGDADACILYVAERPLGTLIFEHNNQDRGWWCSEVIAPLCDVLKSKCRDMKREAAAFRSMQTQLNSGNAVSLFVVCVCIDYYFAAKKNLADQWGVYVLEGKSLHLTNSFKNNPLGEKMPITKKELENLMNLANYTVSRNKADLRIWRTQDKPAQEFVIVKDSFIPALYHYFHVLDSWGMRFQYCSVCGRCYVAQNGHYTLCGDQKCEREQNRRNKRAHDKRRQPHEKKYDDIRDGMKRKINQIKAREDASPELIERAQDAYTVFRKFGITRKNAAKTKKEKDEFIDWLFEQERRFDELYGGKL